MVFELLLIRQAIVLRFHPLVGDYKFATFKFIPFLLLPQNTKLEVKDFIKKFSDACGIHPRDMYDEEGYQLIDDDMAKAMEEAEEKGNRILNSILGSIQETNERQAAMN